ncbi:MAG: tetraacyldisaccharide 4'-kinase [Candidatus Nealsonbacteria bacterium]|nr:tetraacyldisaccharide 4'-kinase [Candidatus Nealsonbacteria bacterium]
MRTTPSKFRDLVSGRRGGLPAALLRTVLRASEVPYSWAVRWRNWRYDRAAAEICRVDVPVISVGNLTLGGTGKTPVVEWIARWCRRRDVRVAIVSRGYGAEVGSRNDEALELQQKLPDVPHVQNADRVAAARTAIEKFACQLIVLDDAFQHRRIARDLDVVLLDALEPFGFGHVFPRGTLREPLVGLRRVDVVALSRADALPHVGREDVRRQVNLLAPDALYIEVTHAPQALLSSTGREEPLESLAQKPVAAFCGIGNPAGFRHTLNACGYRVVALREFPDHHGYDRGDVERLKRWADSLDVSAVLCTHKDLVKLRIDRLGRQPLRAVRVGLEILAGRAALEKRLEALLPANSRS